MDDERYARYLGDESGQNSQKSDKHTVSQDGNDARFQNVSAMLIDARQKLGLEGLSNGSIIILMIAICLLCAFGIWTYSPNVQNMLGGRSNEDVAVMLQTADERDDDTDDNLDLTDSDSGLIYVHVSGAVHNPGVYQLPVQSRAVDALNAAGGFLDDSARQAVNLAAEVEDGTQIHVLTQEEFKEGGGSVPTLTGGQKTSAMSGSGGSHDAAGLVNLNTADSATLQTLPGIGPVTADNIIADREANGPYSSIEDLTRVSGIGPKRVEALQGVASVGN
ncbi:MAG: ComEA family DNA-binding protein [Coriobacteriia bacterium]|nr:ComEA family DNA-binding protein [Coriobacteriia bacterium]